MLKKLLSWLQSTSWKLRITILVVLLLIGGVIYSQTRNSNTRGYDIATVEKHDILEVVSESGNLSVAGVTDVFSPTNGIIAEVYVNNGDLVGKDQELFKVVSTATEDDRAAALANLAAKTAALKTAEQTKLSLQAALETARQGVLDAQQGVDDKHDARINDPDVYSVNERDSIDSELTSARLAFDAAEKKFVEADVAINSARAAVASAQLTYDSTMDRVVKSPTIGTVSNLSVASGNSILANGGTAQFPALTVANFSSNQIVLEINETDVSKIKVGQAATIYPDALPNSEYIGTVVRVDDLGQDDDGVITYNAYIDIGNPDEHLKSGMTVDVDIITSQLTGVLSVPNAAVKPYQGGRAVRVLNRKSGELENIPVVIGTRGETYTEILEGVTEGQEIVVSLSNDNIQRSPFGF